MDFTHICAQDQQGQRPINLKFHQIDPQIHLVTPVEGIFPRVYLSGTRHNLSKIASFVGDLYILDDYFGIFLSGCMFCCVYNHLSYILIGWIRYSHP